MARTKQRVKILGARNLRMALQKMGPDVVNKVSPVMERGIRSIQRTAIALVPKDTSNLAVLLASKQAVGKLSGGLKYSFGFRTKSLRKKGYYAHFVEFGTKSYQVGEKRSGHTIRKQISARPAQPFMRPALDVNRSRIVGNTEKAINLAIRGFHKRGKFKRTS